MESRNIESFTSPVRRINASVKVYEAGTQIYDFLPDGRLISFEISRAGEGKFFGYGICHRINVKVIDQNREIELTTAMTMKVMFEEENLFPEFHITEVNRDELTNELSITAYDALYFANQCTVADLSMTPPYSLADFTDRCVEILGFSGLSGDYFPDLYYEDGANFDGTEQLRDVLDQIAEVSISIYSLDQDGKLVFRVLDKDGEPSYIIDKSSYFTLDSKTNRRLVSICHTTELGDNVDASLSIEGSTQYIRNNPFWDLRDDIGTLLDDALGYMGGLTINQFECEWRGNPALKIGDKIGFITKDDKEVYSYLLNDSFTYDGGLVETTEWEYEEDDETESNSSNLGEALKNTYAKVDKANKQIDLVAKDVKENAENIAAIQLTTNEISASVEQIEKNVDGSLDSLGQEIDSLSKKVAASMTAEDVSIEIKKELINNGTTSVTTTTGFTFNEEGMTVAKSDSEMKTTITEDGMKIYRNDDEVLTVNNSGVDAENLHATTYLIIGKNSRFEDYGDRTGCFWIGN